MFRIEAQEQTGTDWQAVLPSESEGRSRARDLHHQHHSVLSGGALAVAPTKSTMLVRAEQVRGWLAIQRRTRCRRAGRGGRRLAAALAARAPCSIEQSSTEAKSTCGCGGGQGGSAPPIRVGKARPSLTRSLSQLRVAHSGVSVRLGYGTSYCPDAVTPLLGQCLQIRLIAAATRINSRAPMR